MSSISSLRGVYKNNEIFLQILGEVPIDSFRVQTLDDYDSIYRIRHDAINALISECRNLPFGEITVQQFFEENKISITKNEYYTKIMMQTPDVMCLIGDRLHILEITVSIGLQAESQKHSKYALLQHFLKINGIKFNFEVIVINPNRVYKDRESLILHHKLDEVTIDNIKKICDNTNSLIADVRSTPDGSSWHLQRMKMIEEDQSINFSIDDVKAIHEVSNNKIVHNDDDLNNLLNETESTITYFDNQFLENVADLVQTTESKMTKKEIFDEKGFVNKINKMSNSENKRSFFPLPYIALRQMDSAQRSTIKDLEKIRLVCADMENSSDVILNKFANGLGRRLNELSSKHIDDIVNEDFLFSCPLSNDERAFLAIDGPNRKHYVNKGSEVHIKKQLEHHLYSLKYETDVEEISKLLMDLSKIGNIDEQKTLEDSGSVLSRLSGLGLDYVKIIQSIYREININSMRGDRRRKHIVKPTGVDGVFVLIYRGPKMRCGELANLVWFKVLIRREFYLPMEDFGPKWAFKSIYDSGSIFHSGWLSCDAHRLDHYIRAYDKILMSYYSTINLRYRTSWDKKMSEHEDLSLIKMMKDDKSDLLGVIISTYLEDRRTTSKMLQYVRYLVMTSISIYPYFNSVMEKIIEPVRSPLQLYYMKRMVLFAKDMQTYSLYKNYEYGHVKYDVEQRIFKDVMGGARLKLPRPIVKDPVNKTADFHEILSEMYLCMLFNKNQDDPTHASFQILTKMLEGEESMQKMKSIGKHLGYRNDMTDIEWASDVINDTHSHKFSAKAIEIGSKLLRVDQGDTSATEILLSRNNSNLNKTLDEFATYKSSSVSQSLRYDEKKTRQNPRRKCIEGVMEEERSGRFRAFDVALDSKNDSTDFQLFKKNQIGGVREILILTLRNRVSINILETLSRNICRFIPGEILTHGTEKFETLRDVLFEVRKKKGKRMSMFYSFDKSRWGPSFVPIQFIYLFTPFKRQLGSIYYYILHLLIRHQNKRCFYPDRLMNQWIKDPKDVLKHSRDPLLQKHKEEFLFNGKKLCFMNESNMGQGILHYTSSYLHAAMISFRDKLYEIICKREKWDHMDHKDLYSSDDSFTAQSIEIDNIEFFKKKMIIFLKCQEVSERLFNCVTSKAKSSINPLIGEFNSLFLSNLTFYPTILKFAIASVHPVNTDSFYRMVKESYISCRQIVENGGSMELYLIANYLNKDYCETIYHTGSGMQNALDQLGLNRIPFQLGCYPIFKPSLMIMFGPEYHNYSLYKNWNLLSDVEQVAFMNSHIIDNKNIMEALSEMETGDATLGGLIRIEAKVGPVRQLNKLRESSILSREKIIEMMRDDPLIIIRRPKTEDDIIFKTCQKLFVMGANEAMKSLTASIYFGRVSATVSADIFYLPHFQDETKKFKDCLHDLLETKTNLDVQKYIKFLYPNWFEYESVDPIVSTPILGKIRSVFEIQTVRKLAFHKIHTKLYNSVSDLLEHFWMSSVIDESLENKYIRDWDIIKNYFPIIKNTIEETMEQFEGSKEEKTTSLNMLILKLFSLKDKTFKGIIHGPSSIDIKTSNDNLIKHNFISSETFELPINPGFSNESFPSINYNDMYFSHNYSILSRLEGKVKDCWDEINKEHINVFMMDPSIGKNIKKRILMCLLENDIITDILKWSEKTSSIIHSWGKRQRFDAQNNKWFGDCVVCFFCGQNRLFVRYQEQKDKYYLSKNDFDDPHTIYNLINEAMEVFNIEFKDFMTKLDVGRWFIDEKTKTTTYSNSSLGIQITRTTDPPFNDFGNAKLSINGQFTNLIDYSGKRIMSVKTGLLACSFVPKINFDDFEINGVSMAGMTKLGVMTNNFEFQYKSKTETLDLLNDTKVNRPEEISYMTKSKLNLGKRWKVRDDDSKNDFEVELASDDTPTMETQDDRVKRFMDVDLDFIDETLLDSNLVDLGEFVDAFLTTDFFVGTSTTSTLSFPKKILNNVLTFKPLAICHQLLHEMKINRQIISQTVSLFRDVRKEDILNALIIYYDQLYHTDATTPPGINIEINENFIHKFALTMVELTDIIEDDY